MEHGYIHKVKWKYLQRCGRDLVTLRKQGSRHSTPAVRADCSECGAIRYVISENTEKLVEEKAAALEDAPSRRHKVSVLNEYDTRALRRLSNEIETARCQPSSTEHAESEHQYVEDDVNVSGESPE